MNICHQCVKLWKDRIDLSAIKDDGYELSHHNSVGSINLTLSDSSNNRDPIQLPVNPECSHYHEKRKFDYISLGNDKPIKFIKSVYNPAKGPFIFKAAIDYPHSVFRDTLLFGVGIDFSSNIAVLKAVIEAIERYVYYLPPIIPIFYGTAGDLAFQNTLSSVLISNDETWWGEAINAKNNQKLLIPIEMIGISKYYQRGKNITNFRNDTTTGFAIHTTYENAFLNGFLEYIERHIMSNLWRNGFLFRVDKSTLNNHALDLLKLCYKDGYEVEIVFEKYRENFYFFWVFILSTSSNPAKPALVSGASCSADPNESLLKAFLEAFKGLKRAEKLWPTSYPSNPSNLYDHFLFYLEVSNASQICKEINFPSLKLINFYELEYSFKEDSLLKDFPEEVIYVPLSNTFLEELGLCAVQVIIPELETINWDQDNSFYKMPLPFS